jgi:hypothetical protein
MIENLIGEKNRMRLLIGDDEHCWQFVFVHGAAWLSLIKKSHFPVKLRKSHFPVEPASAPHPRAFAL